TNPHKVRAFFSSLMRTSKNCAGVGERMVARHHLRCQRSSLRVFRVQPMIRTRACITEIPLRFSAIFRHGERCMCSRTEHLKDVECASDAFQTEGLLAKTAVHVVEAN